MEKGELALISVSRTDVSIGELRHMGKSLV